MLAPGAMPSPPTRPATRSDRMSPNRLVVTSTSNCQGLSTSFIAQASTITAVHHDAALVLLLVHLLGRLLEDAGQRLHDVGLVHDGHLLAAQVAIACSKANSRMWQAAGAGVDAGGHGHGMRVVVDLHIVLVADVQAFQVLAHDDEVDLVEAPAGASMRARRAQVGVELELLAQAHVGARAVATARGRLQRPLQRQARAADAVQRGLAAAGRRRP